MPSPIPSPSLPFVDPRTGTISNPWYYYLMNLGQSISTGGAPSDADYVLTSPDGTLPNADIATSSTSVIVNTAVSNVITWERAALTGDITAAQNSNVTELSNTGVTPGTYGDASNVGQFTVDEDGRITAASDIAIATAGYPTYLTSVAITNTQFKALPTTYIEVVAAPGANKVLIFLFGVLYLQTAVAYTNIDLGSQQGLAIAYGDWASDASNFYNFNSAGAGFLATVQPYHQIPDAAQLLAAYPDVTITTGSPNTPLKAIAWNSGDYTGGDAANSYRVVTAYCIFDQVLGTLV